MKMLRGVVESIVNGGVYVIVPEYDDTDALGPMETLYATTAPSYSPGDRVLVGQVGNVKEDLVVMGKVGTV